jgi:UDP-glucuronate 4-epimerase
MRVLLTGSAGFIGYHLARRLLADGHAVVGFDGLTDYYDPALKRARHAALATSAGFSPVIGMLEDRAALEAAYALARPEIVIHLAAQAGVRYSLERPDAYASANLIGTHNLLELARNSLPRHLLFASTSSVYGALASRPFRETDRTDTPLTLYAATKKAGEAMSHAYAHLFGIPTTAMRFFTVYGPWGRPDMALYRFVEAIDRGRPIELYGEGRMRRDFTFVDDLVAATVRLIAMVPEAGRPVAAADSISPVAPWRVVNLGGGRPLPLHDFVAAIERAMGQRAQIRRLPMQPGDVSETEAATDLLRALCGPMPATPISDGVEAFVAWYRTWVAANR